MDPTDELAGLTGILRAAAEAHGRPAAMRLAGALGGRYYYFPSPARLHLPRHRWYRQALGEELAMWCAERYGGDRVRIPMGAPVRRLARNRAIIRAYDGGSGLSVTEIAAGHGLTERTVERILAGDL